MFKLKLLTAFGSRPIRRANSIVRSLSFSKTMCEEQKIEVGGIRLNYLKVGNGPHHLLCTPGALGSIWTDFKPQIENFDRSKFTIVAWDPPGYGKSRPPNRDFAPGFHHRDAEYAAKLMEVLGIEKYSLIGWSNGGIVSLIVAANHPERIKKLILWGSNSFFIKPEIDQYQAFRDHSLLSPALKAPYIALYGEEDYTQLWEGWIDGSAAIFASETKGDICKSLLPRIVCPTLILHGEKDTNIAPLHPPYLVKNIKNSRFHLFKEGKHHVHMQFYKEFNKLVEDFLLEEDKTSKL